MKFGFNIPEGNLVDLTVAQDGHSASARIERWGQAHVVRSARSGRVNTLPLAIATTPQGALRARADGTTLDLRQHKAAGNFVAMLDDGRKMMVETTPRQQKDGFSAGEYYWLPVNPSTGKMVFQPGRNHLTLHFSGRTGAYTRAMVATEANVSAATVTLDWLRVNPQYGTQTKPLAEDVADVLLPHGQPSDKLSLWLLFERGYTYTQFGVKRFMRGQSPLHPLLFGAWGTGAKPKTQQVIQFTGSTPEHVVFQDLHFEETFYWLGGRGLICDGTVHNGETPIQNMDSVTFRDTKFLDVWHDAPVMKSDGTPFVFDEGTGPRWDAFNNRMSSIYGGNTQGMFFDGVLFDVGGYNPDYDYNQAADKPHPPSMFSHCAYIAASCRDVMARETIFARGASKGFDLRPGGYGIDCVMIDNEIPMPSLGGNYGDSGPVGEYTMFLGNVVTVAGHKRIAGGTGYNTGAGAYDWGIEAIGREGALIDNICAHRSDPNDPADQAKRPTARSSYRSSTHIPLFDNTIEYRWGNAGTVQGDQRTDGLNPATLDQTTVQKFADQKRATTGSKLADFYAYIREQRPAEATRAILQFFRQGFGTYVAPRAAAATVTFQPDWRAEGSRWDNRLNWTTGDVPGVAHNDTVSLLGHDLKFGNHVAQIASLTSAGGALDVVSGKLTISAAADPLTAQVRNCGQLWVGAMAPGAVLKTETAGRVVFTAPASGHDLTVAGNQSEVVLGATHTIAAGKLLDLRSGRSFVGWDGTGNANLTLNGSLRMAASMTIETSGWNSRMKPGSTIRGETSGFRATVEWVEHVNRYPDLFHIHLRDPIGVPAAGEVFTADAVYSPKTSSSKMFDPAAHDHDDPEWNPTVIPTGTINRIVSVAMPRIAPFVSGIYGAGNPSVAPSVALSGPLVLNLTGVAAGTIPLISAAITGTFSGVTATGLAANLDATVRVAADGVTLTVAAGTGRVTLTTVPSEPSTPALPRVSVTGGQITSFSRGGVNYIEIRFGQSGSFTVAETVAWHRRALAAGGGTGGRSERDTVMPGAGGAGGFAQVLDTALAAGTYAVTVGAGAPGYSTGVIGQANGANSRLTGPGIDLTLTGGGSGGSYKTGANFEIGTLTGLPGGSGGGGRATSGGGMTGGAGVAGQGHQGGVGNGSAVSSAGGSGGAGGVGGNGGSAPSTGGPAGAGVVLDWIATPRTVCAGERGLVGADKGASSLARDYGSGSRGAVNGAVGKGGDGFLFVVLRADQADVVAA